MVLNPLHWHTEAFQEVVERIQRKTLGHSQLLCGEQGVGKLEFAKAVAASLLCVSPNAEGACGQCKQCQLFVTGNHSDFRRVSPEEKSKTVKVDAIRQLSEFLSKSSLQGGAKVAIIEPAEGMNINASNALLKTLEEPANETYLLLVTHNKGRLLPTIKSRCQEIALIKPTRDLALKWLEEHCDGDIPLSSIVRVLDSAAGAPLKAMDLVEKGCAEVIDKVIPDLIGMMKSQLAVSALAERWDDEHLYLRLTILIDCIEQIAKLSVTDDSAHVKDERAGKMFAYLADKVSADQIFGLRDLHLKELRLLSGLSNPNPRLSLELLLSSWKNLMRKAA